MTGWIQFYFPFENKLQTIFKIFGRSFKVIAMIDIIGGVILCLLLTDDTKCAITDKASGSNCGHSHPGFFETYISILLLQTVSLLEEHQVHLL